MTSNAKSSKKPELLAPAGGPEAGYAALQYGADAIYLGLSRFSARAEAENFTPEQLGYLVNYAHSLTPRRRVFVTVNTVVQQRELPELVDTLFAIEEARADAVIVQDLGVWRLVQSRFPRLRLHASTQMAIHNREGAEILKQMGAQRVTLAREMTLDEIRSITTIPGLEVEMFLHGALCYCYSGLCLFSSHMTGRSANRGRCAYPCRDRFRLEGLGPQELSGHAFSMKDLALGDTLDLIRAAGVDSLKIEGRKKSALYVACVTAYYRRLLNGRMNERERRDREEQIRTVFSRPWTRLFVRKAHEQGVIDPDLVGHRGTVIGKVEKVIGAGQRAHLRLTVQRAVEQHDGLQVDVQGLDRPFGFAVETLSVRQPNGRYVRGFEAPAGSLIDVELPDDHPHLPLGAPVYLASSQAVKRAYPVQHPRPQEHRPRLAVRVVARVNADGLHIVATAGALEVTADLPGPFDAAKEPRTMADSARQVFEKTGDVPFKLDQFDWFNPGRYFIPVSRLNVVRRQVLGDLAARLEESRRAALTALQAAVREESTPVRVERGTAALDWSIQVDDPACLAELAESDWAEVAEVVVDISVRADVPLSDRLDELARRIGHDRIRLGLPVILRDRDRGPLLPRIAALRAAGWTRWQVANLWGWQVLGEGMDITADWTVYVLNGLAVQTVLGLGASRVALSPEDDGENIRALLESYGPQATVIFYQDTPLFIAEACPKAALTQRCQRDEPCDGWEARAVSSHGQHFLLTNREGRTVLVSQTPFCLADRLENLKRWGLQHARVDFQRRAYTPREVLPLWRLLRAGKAPSPSHPGNFDRGLA